ncbi:hypothetical protein BGZ57DRAFT_861358 [Hyaloscypha finlandica]|nr:hypothetical protein BGZ57DRAFT_861358 [Hyaloscypha finlandica]
MLLGKLFTSLAFAAMAIAPVKRTTIGDHARDCYNGVQVHYNNITHHIHDHGGIITVNVAATILVELDAILALIVTLVAQITGNVLVQVDIQDSVPVFIDIVILLTTLLNTIYSSCGGGKLHAASHSLLPLDGAVISLFVSVVVSISLQITIISSSLILTINGLLGLILSLLGSLLGGILGSLKLDIKSTISLFDTAIGHYH